MERENEKVKTEVNTKYSLYHIGTSDYSSINITIKYCKLPLALTGCNFQTPEFITKNR